MRMHSLTIPGLAAALMLSVLAGPLPTRAGSPATPGETATPEDLATPTVTKGTATPKGTPTPKATPTKATPTPTKGTATPKETATPKQTATNGGGFTPGGGPSPTPTPLDHFQCYETHRRPINLAGVSLEDEFGASTVTVKQAKRFCPPANKNNGDPTAPTHPDHLTYYTIEQTSPKFEPVKGLVVTNQFGTLTVNAVRPDRLLVPTAKSLSATPPPLTAPTDHFKCYRVTGQRFRASRLSIQDQFGTITVDIKQPLHLCAPVDKNGEGIINPVQHLMCYQVRLSSGTPLPSAPANIFALNQFGADQFTFFGPRDLCVPSTVTLP